MDLAYLVAALAPSHALHGPFTEQPSEVGRRAMCSCGAGLDFSPMAIATVLIFDDRRDKKETSRGA